MANTHNYVGNAANFDPDVPFEIDDPASGDGRSAASIQEAVEPNVDAIQWFRLYGWKLPTPAVHRYSLIGKTGEATYPTFHYGYNGGVVYAVNAQWNDSTQKWSCYTTGLDASLFGVDVGGIYYLTHDATNLTWDDGSGGNGVGSNPWKLQAIINGSTAQLTAPITGPTLALTTSYLADCPIGGPGGTTIPIGLMASHGAPVAYGYVADLGSGLMVNGAYNVSNFSNPATGSYTITLPVQLADPSKACCIVTPQAINAGVGANWTITSGGGTTSVSILIGAPPGGMTATSDNFSFMIFGK